MSTLAITIVQQSDNTYKIFFFFPFKRMHALVKMKPCRASLPSHTEKNSTHERL